MRSAIAGGLVGGLLVGAILADAPWYAYVIGLLVALVCVAVGFILSIDLWR